MLRSLVACAPALAGAVGVALAARPAPTPLRAARRKLAPAQPGPGVVGPALGQLGGYWNCLGWRELFSATQFTERQRGYTQGFKEGTYPLQAVVNGRYECVGSRRYTGAGPGTQAARAPRAPVALTKTGRASQVGQGENAGRPLPRAAMVHTLGLAESSGTFSAITSLTLNATWNPDHLRTVVLVQETGSHHLAAVAPAAGGRRHGGQLNG